MSEPEQQTNKTMLKNQHDLARVRRWKEKTEGRKEEKQKASLFGNDCWAR